MQTQTLNSVERAPAGWCLNIHRVDILTGATMIASYPSCVFFRSVYNGGGARRRSRRTVGVGAGGTVVVEAAIAPEPTDRPRAHASS